MNVRTIYNKLVAAGMSPEGAAGFMGNMQAESAMRANNAQNGMTKLSDEEYTAGVDNGTYTNFVRDAVGYGLCQWTYWSRKQALYDFAKAKGTSIGNEAMQVEFAVQEVKNGYPDLWKFLCTTESVEEAAERVCITYERPAVNNIDVRAAAGLRILDELFGEADPSKPTTSHTGEVVDVKVAVLKKGSTGAQVKALQALLIGYGYDLGRTGVDGSFGALTDQAVRKYQSRNGLATDGSVGPATWSELLGA